jgi:Lar family restriction alleviation protein
VNPNLNVRLVKPSTLKLHPQAYLVPETPTDQYKLFLADVTARHTIDEPLKLIPGTETVIDGRTRLKAAIEAGFALVPVVDADLGDESPLAYMMRVALLRRHLKPGQRAALGVALKKQLAKDAKERQREGGKKGGEKSGQARRGEEPKVVTNPPQPSAAKSTRAPSARDQAAAIAGSSAGAIADAERVEKKSPATFEKLQKGDVTLSEAKREAGVATPKKATPIMPAKPLSQIEGFPPALAAAMEILHVRTDVQLEEQTKRWKGSHEERLRQVLDKAPGTYAAEVERGASAFLDYLYPGRKKRKSPEEQLEDLGLLSKKPTAAEVICATLHELKPCPFCGTVGDKLGVLGKTTVVCHECGALGPNKPSDEAARAAWNKRAKP